MDPTVPIVTLLDEGYEGLGDPMRLSQTYSVAKPERAERKQHGKPVERATEMDY